MNLLNWYSLYKKAQSVKWFEWEDPNGGTWVVEYRDLDPKELYENGRAKSNEELMKLMIIGIQNKWEDKKLTPPQVEYFLKKFPLIEDFFDEVTEAEKLFRDEQRIEERDIEMGL